MGQTSKVMVVDANAVARTVYQSYFANTCNGEINCFKHRRDAQTFISRNQSDISLIVLDINIPGSDGAEFLSFLRDQRYEGQVVIGCDTDQTKVSGTAQLAEIYGLKLRASIIKPFTKHRLDNLFDLSSHGQSSGMFFGPVPS